MRAVRLVPAALVVVGLVAVTSWWPGRGVVDADLSAPVVPVGRGADAASTTWFCAAGTALTSSPPEHRLLVSNPTDEAATVLMTGYGPDGETGAETAEVEPHAVLRVETSETLGAAGASVMVESASPELAVEHQLVLSDASDQVPCATSSSDRWYFPAQSTHRVVDGSTILEHHTAQLVLFNPFSSDAAVDITAAAEDQVLVPPAWAGLVIPAGTVRVVDLGDGASRRDQLSVSVVLRSGRLVAESVQAGVGGDPEDPDVASLGLRLQLGVPSAGSRWALAAGFTGEGARERLVVYNPGESTANVVIQVVPVGGASMPPEPFELDVASRRYGVVDLSEESRVPGVGYHAIQVETDDDTPVVVGRVLTVTGDAGEPPEPVEGESAPVLRPDVGGGTTIDTGTPVASSEWLVPYLGTRAADPPAVVVHNPGSGIVSVTVTVVDGGLVLAEGVEVAAGDGLVLPVSHDDFDSSVVALRLTATGPVVVERLVTYRRPDLSLGLAVPYPSSAGEAFPLIAEL